MAIAALLEVGEMGFSQPNSAQISLAYPFVVASRLSRRLFFL